MKGAIIGDIVGSVYEFNNIKTKDFPLFKDWSYFTDDSVLTCAVANAIVDTGKEKLDVMTAGNAEAYVQDEAFTQRVRYKLRDWGRQYEGAGYGRKFYKWLNKWSDGTGVPYYSCGNGSAMRVSPVGLIARTEGEAIHLAKLTADPTHNHPDGIRGAVATALCTYAAKSHNKNAVREVIQTLYPYNFLLDDIRDEYYFGHFQATNEGTVPYAVQAFLESDSFEDAIRNAISIGGDSDTLAAITGGIAEAYYGVPDNLWDEAKKYLDKDILAVVDDFYRLKENMN